MRGRHLLAFGLVILPVVVRGSPLLAAPAAQEGGAIAYGETVSGNLSAGQVGRWSFSGVEGERIIISMQSGTFDTLLEVRDADGEQVAQDDDAGMGVNALISDLALPASGSYTIIARGFRADASGPYTLTLEPVQFEAQSAAGNVVMLGETVTGLLDVDARDEWTFSANAGDVVSVSLASPHFDAFLELRDAFGNLLTSNDDSGEGLDAEVTAYPVRRSGEYTVMARSFETDAGGEYTLRVAPAEHFALNPIGERGTINGTREPGEWHLWTFEGRAGDVVTLRLESAEFDGFLELQDPDGREFARDDDSGGGLNAAISTLPLPQTGMYTIVVRDFGRVSGGAYTLSLQHERNLVISQGGGKLEYGATITAMLEEGTRDRWIFTGSAGDVVTISMSSKDLDSVIELRGPAGQELARDDDSAGALNARISAFTLPETGAYTIIAGGFNRSAGGSYKLMLELEGV